MEIKVKAKNPDDSLIFEGALNREEVGFLLQYAINSLLAQGVQFDLQEDPSEKDDEPEKEKPIRLKFPKNSSLN
jgi:hypothetical protein